MKENKNNELQMDDLEQVAGGDGQYSAEYVCGLYNKIDEMIAESQKYERNSPEALYILDAANQTAKQLRDITGTLDAETKQKVRAMRGMN